MPGDTTTVEHVSGEHPLVTVNQRAPLPGRRWFAVAAFLGSIAAILAVVLIALPLQGYFDRQDRADRELACRNLIGNALQEAQATLTADLALGLTAVVREEETADILTQIDLDRARVRSLGDLRSRAVKICQDDPHFDLPADLSGP